MPSTLSADLRERVVVAIEAGASGRQATRRSEVSPPAPCAGTKPSCGIAQSKLPTSGVVAAMIVAESMPTPGIVTRRWLVSLWTWAASISRVNCSIRTSVSTNCSNSRLTGRRAASGSWCSCVLSRSTFCAPWLG